MEKVTEKDLKNLPLQQIQEMLQRQNGIVCRSCVMSKLIDKGASARKFRDALIKELERRKSESQLAESFLQMNIDDNSSSNDILNEKHVKYVCEKETVKPDNKFKPFATLTHAKESSPKKESAHKEISSALEPRYTKEGTKLVTLPESLALQKDQVNRLKQEQLKKYLEDVEVIEGTEVELGPNINPDEQLVNLDEEE